MASSCPQCGIRKAKRDCPALGVAICSVCCGTKRQVEIRCPPTCSYLSSSRSHPPAVVLKRQERDLSFLVPIVADLNERQQQLFILLQAVILRHAANAVPPLLDIDVADGSAAVAATLETAGRGIIYEHQATSIPAQRLADQLTQTFEEIRKEVGSAAARLDRDAAVALRRLEQGARTAGAALPDDEPPVFVTMLRRVVATAADSQEGTAEASSPAPPLIVPG